GRYRPQDPPPAAGGCRPAGGRGGGGGWALPHALLAPYPEAPRRRRDPAHSRPGRPAGNRARPQRLRRHRGARPQPRVAAAVHGNGRSHGGSDGDLPHGRRDRLSPARGRSRHGRVRRLLPSPDRRRPAQERDQQLRHGASQIHHRLPGM
ncbi:MAG: Transcriptional regulator, AsnC family, partial [uncultured Sphingomonas sp.]